MAAAASAGSAAIDAGRFWAPAPPRLPSYGDPAYWLARYAERGEEVYDWYMPELGGHVAPLVTPESQILILGCGTSALCEQLYAQGFVNVTCIDRCAPLIEALREKHKDKEATVSFQAAEAERLPDDWAGRFDLVLDKALLDSVACGEQKWARMDEVLQSVSKVLKPSGGTYLCVSHAGVETRRPMLHAHGKYGWDVECRTVPRGVTATASGDKPPSRGAKPPDPQAGAKLTASAAYDPSADVYHIYVCSLPAA
ncbi:unnamed protein product [Prorocentrum cordatum]|uniref:Methyltransferase domain-containing protein n=1 Tax=Prorocentrum cordatum TaxID=2364126 RepID=A0ABN9XWC3_9DINO|nr:unnamed protein product [Polarella glacialis]